MTRTRMFMFAALAGGLALSVGAQAQSLAENPHIKLAVLGKAPVHAASPEATPSNIYQGITEMGVLPPTDAGGDGEWPCFGGNADCSTIAAGGLVIGLPVYTWSLTNCTTSTTSCGQVAWTFEDDNTTSGEIEAQVEVKQGTSVIYDSGYQKLAKNTGYDGYVLAISFDVGFGVGNCVPTTVTCVAPVAGAATITVSTKIGSGSPVSGTYKITLQ